MKLAGVVRLWALALAISALLVAAGERWPAPLPLQLPLVWGLVWLPPLAMGLWLLARWRLPGVSGVPDPGAPDPDRGESID
ncbi:MAG: hypothetical protein RLZZ268_1056 [Cyanobacteriota bacterium]|jgi:hypothetical protein